MESLILGYFISPKSRLPVTRVHLTASLPDAEEPSTRCSFTAYADLDP